MLGKIEGRRKGVSENEAAGWYHRCNGHDLGQTLGDVRDREAWCAAVHGSQRAGHDWGTEQFSSVQLLRRV